MRVCARTRLHRRKAARGGVASRRDCCIPLPPRDIRTCTLPTHPHAHATLTHIYPPRTRARTRKKNQQGPLSRFGDTASNAGMLALLASYEQTSGLPVGAQTLAASAVAGCFRVLLMPVDTLKTTLQVSRGVVPPSSPPKSSLTWVG